MHYFPRNAQQVAATLDVLRQNNERFAVESGGHSPNPGWKSINGGPLIATRRMNHVMYDPNSQSIRIGPGNHWHNVTNALQNTGVTVVSGRLGEVGVGGLLLGGGLSYLSGQHGWSANNVLEYEVVLAISTVVIANGLQNQDLWTALRGGGSSFGIITSFTMRAIPQAHQCWGGVRIYRQVRTPDMLAAIRSFTENYPDPKAAIIATAEVTVANLVDIWIVFMFFDGPDPGNSFAAFDDIRHSVDLTKERSYHDMVSFGNTFVLKNQIYTIGTETMPVPNATVGPVVMKGIYDTWHDIATSIPKVPGAVASIAFQPLPRMMVQRAKELGGTVMDFDDTVDRIVIELDYSYWYARDTPVIDQTMVKTYTSLGNKVKDYQSAGFLPQSHLPLFMNDAYYRQDYWARLKPERSSRFKQIRASLDPMNMLMARTNGFHTLG